MQSHLDWFYHLYSIIFMLLPFLFPIDVAIKQASWDATKIREKLCRDIEAHADSVRCAKLSELKAGYEV